MSIKSFLSGKTPVISTSQQTVLVLLRLAIGWHFLYEGISKILNPNWSSIGYLLDSKGLFSGIFYNLAANPSAMEIVDFLNIWGLTLIGLGLMLGFLSRLATVSGILLLLFYYLSHPALISVSYAIPSEGNYLWVNKTLIEMIALAVLFYFPTSRLIGLDRFLFNK